MRKTRGLIVVFVLGLVASVEAEPLDKAKVVSVDKLAAATIVGVHVAEVEVGDDGALRMRAGVEVKCGTVKNLKKKEGKCVAALPLNDIGVRLVGSLPFGNLTLDMEMTGTIESGWLVFRAEHFTPLVAAASVSSSSADRLTVMITHLARAWPPARLADWPDPYTSLIAPPRTEDTLAPYHSAMDDEDNWDLDPSEGGDLGCGWEDDEDSIYAELPATWLAYAGTQMLQGQSARLVAAYQDLADHRPAAFYDAFASDVLSIAQLDAAAGPAAVLAEIAAGLGTPLEDRVTAAAAQPPALGRSNALYCDLAILRGLYGPQLSADLAETLKRMQRTVADLIVGDVAAFAVAPSVPKDPTARATWEETYELLLRDPAYPAAFAYWVDGRGGLPYLGSGNYQAVVQAALADADLARVVVGAARTNVSSATKQQLTGIWQVQDILTFTHYAYQARPSDALTIKLLVDVGRLLTAPERFDLDVATAFLQFYDSFLTGTDSGRALALELAPTIENRRRTVRTEKLAALDADRVRAATSCAKSVKEAKALLKTWTKKGSKLKGKKRNKLMARSLALSQEIQVARGTLDHVVTELRQLKADELWLAVDDRDACVAPW